MGVARQLKLRGQPQHEARLRGLGRRANRLKGAGWWGVARQLKLRATATKPACAGWDDGIGDAGAWKGGGVLALRRIAMQDGTHIMPRARSTELLVEALPDETLVYDLRRHTAHCLNQPATLLWQACDGRASYAAVATRLGAALGGPVDAGWIALGLEQLAGIELVEPGRLAAVLGQGMSRRDFLRVAGITAAAVPIILTVAAPPSAALAYTVQGGSRPFFGGIRPSRRTRTSRRRARDG